MLQFLKNNISNHKGSLLPVLLIIVGTIILLYNLGKQDFREDEFQVMSAAYGYLNTGQYSTWDWLTDSFGRSYTRAWPHTWLIAQSYQVFGVSEWSSRIVSVLFGLLFYFLLYRFSKYFTGDKKAALAVLATVIFYPVIIDIFRYTRMYALLLPIFLIVVYLLYRGITEERAVNTRIGFIDRFINLNLNFNYRYIMPALLFLYIGYVIHVNILVIIPATYLFVVLLAIIEKHRKYIITSISGLVLLSMLMPLAGFAQYLFGSKYFPQFINFLGFSSDRVSPYNYSYISTLFNYPFDTICSIVLIAFILIKFYFSFRQNGMTEIMRRNLYLYTIVAFSLVFFIFFADRDVSTLYVSHIIPLAIVIIVGSYWNVGIKMLGEGKSMAVYAVLIAFVLFQFAVAFNGIYRQNNFGNFSQAYQVIIDNYNPQTEVVIGQYLRGYYLQELESYVRISMLNNKQYTYNEFLEDIKTYKSGWVTWETRKAYHIDEKVIEYIDKNFKKIHGYGLDDTQVDVYYFSVE